MAKVMIHPATYENIREAVNQAFGIFPLDISGKKFSRSGCPKVHRLLLLPGTLPGKGHSLKSFTARFAQGRREPRKQTSKGK